jgi:Cytochrome c
MGKAMVVLSVMAIGAVSGACRQEPGARDADSEAITLTVPAGNVEAGRQAFLELRCTACHAVPSEPEFPAPVSANPGPPIDARVGGRNVSYLATAIVSPSHELSPDTAPDVREHLAGVLSPMGDFSHTMTVRQLVDLHAYLRSKN